MELVHLIVCLHQTIHNMEVNIPWMVFLKQSTSSHSQWFPYVSFIRHVSATRTWALWPSGWSWHSVCFLGCGKIIDCIERESLQETAMDIFRTQTCGIFDVFSYREILLENRTLLCIDLFRWNLGSQDRLAFHADNFVVDERVSL